MRAESKQTVRHGAYTFDIYGTEDQSLIVAIDGPHKEFLEFGRKFHPVDGVAIMVGLLTPRAQESDNQVGYPLLIVGPPDVEKTTMLEQIAQAEGSPFVIYRRRGGDLREASEISGILSIEYRTVQISPKETLSEPIGIRYQRPPEFSVENLRRMKEEWKILLVIIDDFFRAPDTVKEGLVGFIRTPVFTDVDPKDMPPVFIVLAGNPEAPFPSHALYDHFLYVPLRSTFETTGAALSQSRENYERAGYELEKALEGEYQSEEELRQALETALEGFWEAMQPPKLQDEQQQQEAQQQQSSVLKDVLAHPDYDIATYNSLVFNLAALSNTSMVYGWIIDHFIGDAAANQSLRDNNNTFIPRQHTPWRGLEGVLTGEAYKKARAEAKIPITLRRAIMVGALVGTALTLGIDPSDEVMAELLIRNFGAKLGEGFRQFLINKVAEVKRSRA